MLPMFAPTASQALPTGTVTFLFTDIEDSTRLAQDFPGQWEAALAQHNAVLGESIAANQGRIFESAGDGICAAFPTASAALAAALAAQLRLQALNSAGPALQPSALRLSVRMGIHTGAAEARDGVYTGYLTLVLAQRVMSAAHGGQVLLSRTSYDLVHAALPAGAGLRDMGEHSLKGLAEPEHLWQLLAPSLPSEFPPLHALATLPNNLPVQLTSFIGRESELAEVKQRLGGSRLLTLTGSGGTGKSRLALQVAGEVLASYADGVWLVELAPLSDPALVPSAVAAALGLREQSGQPLESTLAAYLRSRQVLIVLDNCEHLIAACARVADLLLHAAPRFTILATSREALGIAGEVAWHVPSLACPDPRQLDARLPPPAELLSYAAVALFVERATRALASFKLSGDNAPAIVQICYRLDGIPLAIELAAARVRSLSVEQIAARLDDQFRLLTGGSRAALPRQQTLRSLIDWSYNLLDARERRFFNRLSVFAGGWTLEAAEEITKDETAKDDPSATPAEGLGGRMKDEAIPPSSPFVPQQTGFILHPSSFMLQPSDALDLLDQLVNKSLVVFIDSGAAMRYRLLETIRQYAAEKLDSSGETAEIRRRHLAFYVQLASWGSEILAGIRHDRMEREHDNFRAALAWSLDEANGLAASGLSLAASLGYFWFDHGYLQEGRMWFAQALARAPLADESRPRALVRAGRLAWQQGDYAIARAEVEEGTALWRARADKSGLADGVHILGHVAFDQREHDVAQASFVESLALYQELGDEGHVAILTGDLGLVAYHAGNYESARSLFEENLRMYRKSGTGARISDALNRLGDLSRLEGDREQAFAYYHESLASAQASGQTLSAASALHKLGQTAREAGDYGASRALLADSLAQQYKLGNKQGIAECLAAFAGLAFAQGELARAIQWFAVCEQLLAAIGAPLSPADRLPYEHDLAAARASVDDAAFKTAWEAGRELSLDAAVRLVLDTQSK